MKKKILPHLSVIALLLNPLNLYAADPAQVKTVHDYVLASPGDKDSGKRVNVNNRDIGYDGDYQLMSITVPMNNSLFIELKDPKSNETIWIGDAEFGVGSKGIDGIVDSFQREIERQSTTEARLITSAFGKDAQTLGGDIYDRVISLFNKYITK